MNGNQAAEPLRVLVVDDDPFVLDFMVEVLTERGFCVQTARSGEAALRLARMELPDVVLSDLNMPGMDGLELIGRFGAHEDLRTVPCFLMSGTWAEEQGREAGVVRFFQKPIVDAALLARELEAAASPPRDIR